MNYKTFATNVLQWATDRNFFGEGGATPLGQALKGVSEMGELADNLGKGRDIRDDIGDNCVVAVVIAGLIGKGQEVTNYIPRRPIIMPATRNAEVFASFEGLMAAWQSVYRYPSLVNTTMVIQCCEEIAICMGIRLEECLEQAWNDIKDRKGSWHNGVFVKEGDTGNAL